MNILLVEDDAALSDSVAVYLQQDGWKCSCATTFMAAEDRILFDSFDIAIVDITLPGGNGLDIVQQVRKKRPETGIIIISAKNSLDDKLKGLGIGADDYLTKPFHLAELNARIKAIVRRKKTEEKSAIEFNEISIHPDDLTVTVYKSPVELTKKELDLLLYFINNKNRVLTKDAIATHLWGDSADNAPSYDFIYTHIKNLRKKLTEKGGQDYLKSMYGMGYKFSDK